MKIYLTKEGEHVIAVVVRLWRQCTFELRAQRDVLASYQTRYSRQLPVAKRLIPRGPMSLPDRLSGSDQRPGPPLEKNS